MEKSNTRYGLCAKTWNSTLSKLKNVCRWTESKTLPIIGCNAHLDFSTKLFVVYLGQWPANILYCGYVSECFTAVSSIGNFHMLFLSRYWLCWYAYQPEVWAGRELDLPLKSVAVQTSDINILYLQGLYKAWCSPVFWKFWFYGIYRGLLSRTFWLWAFSCYMCS